MDYKLNKLVKIWWEGIELYVCMEEDEKGSIDLAGHDWGLGCGIGRSWSMGRLLRVVCFGLIGFSVRFGVIWWCLFRLALFCLTILIVHFYLIWLAT